MGQSSSGIKKSYNLLQSRFKDYSIGVTRAITSDQDGFIWLATGKGIVRFDGTNFTALKDLIEDIPLTNKAIADLHVDKSNRLWMINDQWGIMKIDLSNYKWREYPEVALRYRGEFYASLFEDHFGTLYFPNDYGISKYDEESDSFEFIEISCTNEPIRLITGDDKNSLYFTTQSEIFVLSITEGICNKLIIPGLKKGLLADIEVDNEGFLWFTNWYNSDLGLVKYDITKSKIESIYGPSYQNNQYIASTDIWQIETDSTGVYFATNSEGLWYYNYALDEFSKIDREERYQESNYKQIRCIHKDVYDRIWLGGSYDVYWQEKHPKNVKLLKDDANDNELPSTYVRSVNELSTGEIGIGTDKGLSLYNPKTKVLRNVSFPLYNNNDYNNQVNGIYENGDELWVSTWSGIIRLDRNTLNIAEYYITFNNAGTDHDPEVIRFEMGAPWRVVKDDDKNLWVIDNGGGLSKFFGQPFKRKIQRYDISQDSIAIGLNRLIYSRNHGLWASSDSALWKYDKLEDRFFKMNLSKTFNHKNISFKDLVLDSNDKMMALSVNSLYEVVPSEDTYKLELQGSLPYNTDLNNINIDKDDIVWLMGEDGLIRWDYKNNQITNLDREVHLYSSSFNKLYDLKRSCLSSEGNLYYASSNGLLYFNKDEIILNRENPNMIFTSILVNDNKIINSPPHLTKSIDLTHDQNNIQLHFSITNDSEPLTRTYFYRLEEKNDWITLGNQPSVSLTGLSPGNYKLQVKGITGDGVESLDPLTLNIHVSPPWYNTKIAYLLYALLIFAIVYAFYRFRLTSLLAKEEAVKIRELDEFKNKFFTNITHEFRTPLTVIKGMADKIEQTPSLWTERGVKMIKRNSEVLLKLINQILDLSKIEQGMISSQIVKNDIIAYIKYLTNSFHSVAEINGLQISFSSNMASFIADYDADKLETIISNLISNSIKYSKDQGEIFINSTIETDEESPVLHLTLRDQGIGISNDNIEKIFDRYYRVQTGNDIQEIGTGIGLALVKELVTLCEGTIRAQSTLGEGTTFVVRIPLNKKSSNKQISEIRALHTNSAPLDPQVNASIKTVLIVEDNDDVAEYIISCINPHFNCLRTANGKEGFDTCVENVPDIVVSDVMMPKVGGVEMLSMIRNHPLTEHIPVIMLTAKADIKDRVLGIEKGAEAYLSKPFEEKELLAHLKSLLEQRDRLKIKYGGSPEKENNHALHLKRSAFIQELRNIVLIHLDDSTFGVEELSSEVNMSSRQLLRKLKAISDFTPNQIIRKVRLEQAKILLKNGNFNISEVSAQVGFTSSNYFSTVFKKEYNLSPAEFMNS